MTEEMNNSGRNPCNIEHVENLQIGDRFYIYTNETNVELDSPTTSQPQPEQQGSLPQTHAEQVKTVQLEKVKSDVVAHDKQINEAEIPDVHPILVETDIYEGQQSDQNEEFIPSTKGKDKKKLDGKIYDFTTLLSLIMTTRFLSIVGPAGSGKSTLSKRIVRALLNTGRFVILIKFMNLSYPTGFTLTLQDLILGNQFTELDKEICENAFEWMKQNSGECVLVFDGFDQFSWTLENLKPLDASYDTPLSVQQLIGNLCSGKFFGNSHLVFTSRQHSMLSLPHDLRPKLAIYVHDLSSDDMKKLFFSFARDSAEELWKILTTESPQLLDLCHNPMLLQFVVCAGLYKGANHLNTITNIFNVVFLQIQRSSFAKGHRFDELKELLGRMAYNGMASKKIIFETADLTKEGLKDVDVQDYVIKSPQHLGFPTQKLFEGDMKFFFMHQLLQEFFAATYIATHTTVSNIPWFIQKHMSGSDFRKIVRRVVNEDHWSMVKRFLCGLLLGNGMKTEKSQIFYDNLAMFMSLQKKKMDLEKPEDEAWHRIVEYVSKQTGSKFRGLKLAEFLVDLQECSDDVKDSLAPNLPTWFDFTGTLMSLSACHALCDILPRIPHLNVELYLGGCKLNVDSLKLITEGINNLRHELFYLDLGDNKFGDDGLILLSKYLNKVKNLSLTGCGITKHGIEVLVKVLKGLPVRDLYLSGNDFGDDGLKLICECLDKINKLKVECCGISETGKKLLIDEICKHNLRVENFRFEWQ